uniref:Uncharacterized protein n=1 Tax=Glossina austeni TaxID=7395 RepID=A0A1A9USJ8_GLOAU
MSLWVNNDHSIGHKHMKYKIQKCMRKDVLERACETRRSIPTLTSKYFLSQKKKKKNRGHAKDIKRRKVLADKSLHMLHKLHLRRCFSQTLLAYQDKNGREQFYVLLLLMYPMPCVLACLVIFGFVMSHTGVPLTNRNLTHVTFMCNRNHNLKQTQKTIKIMLLFH